MASYTRQSTFSDGDLITAALFNDEYNQLLSAFENTTGHKHDGTVGEGPVIGILGDAGVVTPLNKILIDTTNDHIEFWIDVSGTSTQQLYIADGAIVPVTDNDIDLGTSSLQFKDLYINGTANIDSLVADTADINGGTIDGTIIGGTSAAAITGTTITGTSFVIGSASIDETELEILDGATLTTTELNYVDGVTSSIQTQIDTKAPLASPSLTGIPTAPTAASNTNTTQIATTAYVQTEITELIAGAPGTLDTLNELAAAINDDANYKLLDQYYMKFYYKAKYTGSYDENGIPQLNYQGDIGVQYNPIAISQWSLGNYNLWKKNDSIKNYKKFLNCYIYM